MKSKKKFPDLNKDGKVTFADVLKGRGVKKAGKGMKYKQGGKHDPKKPEAKADPKKAPKFKPDVRAANSVSSKTHNKDGTRKSVSQLMKEAGRKALSDPIGTVTGGAYGKKPKGAKGMKYMKGGKYDPKKAAMMKGLEAKIKKAKGTPQAKPLVDKYRKLTGTK